MSFLDFINWILKRGSVLKTPTASVGPYPSAVPSPYEPYAMIEKNHVQEGTLQEARQAFLRAVGMEEAMSAFFREFGLDDPLPYSWQLDQEGNVFPFCTATCAYCFFEIGHSYERHELARYLVAQTLIRQDGEKG
ncbi:MAG: hypothetical protein KDC71_23840 [Acidobacteria bacterium]|nr:hypothetical protein [Acidobacteriota bacterium]